MADVVARIRVVFSIADLSELDQDPDKYDDRALYDEDDDVEGQDETSLPVNAQSGGAQSKGTVKSGRTKGGNINVAPEDSIAPADRPELADDETAQSTGGGRRMRQEDQDEDDEDDEAAQDPSVPIRVEVTIEKAGEKGAMQLETVANDGMIAIENVYFYDDAGMVSRNNSSGNDPKAAERELAKRDMYLGPPLPIWTRTCRSSLNGTWMNAASIPHWPFLCRIMWNIKNSGNMFGGCRVSAFQSFHFQSMDRHVCSLCSLIHLPFSNPVSQPTAPHPPSPLQDDMIWQRVDRLTN